jgi:hypothetical protein
MALTLVLLSPNEDAPALQQVLAAHAREVSIRHVVDLPGLRALLPELGPTARLVSYLSPVIVPKDCLEAFPLGAYNFHPGSPDYPGVAPEAWAAYDHAKAFGATLHIMTAEVDTGAITATETIPAGNAEGRTDYANIARQALALLLSRTAPDLVREELLEPMANLHWAEHRHSIDEYEKMCVFTPDITAKEMEHRLLCFGPPGPVEFSLTLHGRRFILEAPGGIIGHLDAPQEEIVLGWVRDSTASTTRQEVKLVVDGREFLLTADVYRPDVCAAGFGDGYSGFVWNVPEMYRDGRPHRVEALCKGRPIPGSPKLAVFPRSGQTTAS